MALFILKTQNITFNVIRYVWHKIKHRRETIRKCIVSKNDIEFTDDLLDKLKITEAEKENLNEHNILYLDITDTYAFESE